MEEFDAIDPKEIGLVYSLISGTGGEDNELFSLNANGRLVTKEVLDFETKETLSILVQVRER